MGKYGRFSQLQGVTEPTQMTALNDMLRYLFAKVQGGIGEKEMDGELAEDLAAFREPVWQRNMVCNSDLRCASVRRRLNERYDGAFDSSDGLAVAFCFFALLDEGDAVELSDEHTGPGGKSVRVFAASGSPGAGVVYFPEWDALRIDPREAVAAGKNKLLLSFYHTGGWATAFVMSMGYGAFTVTPVSDNVRIADGAAVIAANDGLPQRCVLSFDAAEFGEDCDSVLFAFGTEGATDAELTEEGDNTFYVSAPQIVADKYGGRAPVYQRGLYCEARADGMPVELVARKETCRLFAPAGGSADDPFVVPVGSADDAVELGSLDFSFGVADNLSVRCGFNVASDRPVGVYLIFKLYDGGGTIQNQWAEEILIYHPNPGATGHGHQTELCYPYLTPEGKWGRSYTLRAYAFAAGFPDAAVRIYWPKLTVEYDDYPNIAEVS